MKNINIMLFFFLLILIVVSCSKKIPTEAVNYSPTLSISRSATQTVTSSVIINTATFTLTSTNTMTITETFTRTLTPTRAATLTDTNTPEVTLTAIAVAATYTAVVSMVSVPGGTFTQTDSSIPGASFLHTISSFKLGKYEVAYRLWYDVFQWAMVNGYTFQSPHIGCEGWYYNTCGNAPNALQFQPVFNVNWREAMVWCNAYSQMTGLNPVYYTDAAFTVPIKNATYYSSTLYLAPGEIDNPYINWNSNGYRLPTEGEWQYAASYIDGVNWTPDINTSGSAVPNTDIAGSGVVAWFLDNSGIQFHDVGLKAPNALGIYDMSGNVFEWCWDWYSMNVYYPGPSVDYRGQTTGASINPSRIFRGGSAIETYLNLPIGQRHAWVPYEVILHQGLRVARSN